jgi:hypothetical protein
MTRPTINRSGIYPALCRHCHRKPVIRPRGLCWTCYYTPGVLPRYPSLSKFAVPGVPDRDDEPPLPTPTTAPPGSAAKLAVLRERAARGERLWHPDDATHETTAERN